MGDMTLLAGASDSIGRKEGAKQGHSSLSASCQLMQCDQLPQTPVTRNLDLDFTHEPWAKTNASLLRLLFFEHFSTALRKTSATQGLSWNLALTDWLAWVASKRQWTSCYSRPSADVISVRNHTRSFCMGAGNSNLVFMQAWHTLDGLVPAKQSAVCWFML